MNDLMKEMMSVHQELSLVISKEIDSLNKKYTSQAIKDGLSNLKDYVFIVLCDMMAGVEVENTQLQIRKMRNDKLSTSEICSVLNLKEESVLKLELFNNG